MQIIFYLIYYLQNVLEMEKLFIFYLKILKLLLDCHIHLMILNQNYL